MDVIKPVSFGIALEAMKLGHFFRRQAWEDAAVSVYLMKGTVPRDIYDAALVSGVLMDCDISLFEPVDDAAMVRAPLLVRVTSSSSEPGWWPSCRDLLANDWVAVL